MSFKRNLYLSFFGRIISFAQNLISLFHRPFMVYGYKCKYDNKFYQFVRMSSSVVVLEKEKLQIGDNVWVWHHTIIDASNGVKIGKGCQIGAWVGIFSHSSHVAIRLYGENYIQTPKESRIGYVRKKVEIGDYTFIAANSMIMPGVTIGKGCLIAAGTIVNKSIPDYSIVVGNPCEIKGCTTDLDKKYFSDELVRKNYFDHKIIADYLEAQALL